MSANPAQPAPQAEPPSSEPAAERRDTTGLTGARPVPPEVVRAAHGEEHAGHNRLAILTLTALGVVYGDIGTSPLYAFRECFKPEYGLTPTPENVYGVLSLILWALVLIVSVKYIAFIMRADNRGEGGIFALLALLLQTSPPEGKGKKRRAALVALGLIGAALLYGDGVITPAISVLGAVEGLDVATPALRRFVVPITVVILVGLFLVQKRGTERVGKIFGPVMLAWFMVIGALGAAEMIRNPAVLAAVNPWHGLTLLAAHGLPGMLILGAVVLAVTGAEALYADMGHFGRQPIRLAWFWLVLPALVLNYFGQGALVLRDPTAATVNTFYLLAPRWFLYPLIAIATFAAIVASQALISGAFSLTQQCVQLGYSPRMTIIHTSKLEAGQIYVPEVNQALGLGTILVVLYFGSSGALGAAYGIAVTGTMAITTALFHRVMVDQWHWPKARALAITTVFLVGDLALFGANVVKIEQGGWVPLAIAFALFVLMTTWKRGREELTATLKRQSLPLDLFLEDIGRSKPHRVKGTAVFMTSEAAGVPVVLLHHLKHNKVLHEQVVLLSIASAGVPEVPAGEGKVKVESLGQGFWRVTARYGFMESPDVKRIMGQCNLQGLRTKPAEISYVLGRERLLPTGPSKMARWRKKLFGIMARNARSAAEFFGIPPNRVVELGAQIEL